MVAIFIALPYLACTQLISDSTLRQMLDETGGYCRRAMRGGTCLNQEYDARKKTIWIEPRSAFRRYLGREFGQGCC